MIAYFDASALVKLLIEEPGSITAEQAWYAADARICCSVGMAEVAAAVGRAMRMGRIDSGTAHGILTDLETVWSAVTRMPCDDRLAAEAAQLAVLHGLRGFDAVHLAAARSAAAALVAGDGALLAAANSCGLIAIDVAS